MGIQMIPNSSLGQDSVALKADTALKEGKLDKAGEAVKIRKSAKAGEVVKSDGLAVTEKLGAAGKTEETVRGNQVHETADIDQMTAPGKDGKTEGSMVRRRSLDQYIPEEKTKSFGHYEVVPDGKGNSKIQFEQPDQPSGEKVEGKQTEDSSAGKDAVKKADNRTEGTDGQSQKIQNLKLKKKQLKEQIKAETDSKKVGELKRKLAKVEMELKRNDQLLKVK